MVNIYVLSIVSVRYDWINNPDNIFNRTRELASARGHNVIHVTSLAELQALVSTPPENAVIINGHGEALPIPEEEHGNWISFITKLAHNVREHGWVWVSITGYPFFYYGPDVNRIPQPHMTGLATFLSVSTPSIEIAPISGDTERLTTEGSRALEKLHIRISDPLAVGRCFLWHNVVPIAFLTSGTSLGAGAIPIGRGFFVHCGIASADIGHAQPDQDSDSRIAELALAFSLAICETDLEREFTESVNDENRFRDNVIIPLLQRKGFSGLHTLHPREFGKDLVFYEIDKFGEKKYLATQISVREVHKNVRGDQNGYAGTIARQVEEAFTNPYIDPDNGQQYFIHESYVITSKGITEDAKQLVRDQIGNKRGLVHFFNGQNIVEMVRTIR